MDSKWNKSSRSGANFCVEARWRKGSRSNANGCVEVRFKKSSYSSAIGDSVEVAGGDEIQVRDSKDKNGPVLHFTFAEWDAFIQGVKENEFDLPLAE